MNGETEELLANAKKHGIEVHGTQKKHRMEELGKNKENFAVLIKSLIGFLYFHSLIPKLLCWNNLDSLSQLSFF
jgi:hypothetical protein